MKKLSLMILCGVFLALAGCGFHLRGTYQLPPNFKVVYLQSAQPYTPFMQRLNQTLQRSGVNVVNNPYASPYTLSIQGENLNTVQTSVGSSETVRQYRATYSVTYVLQKKAGKTLYGPRTVSTSTTINLTANEQIESSTKLSETKQNMIQTLVSQLMFQLSSKEASALFKS